MFPPVNQFFASEESLEEKSFQDDEASPVSAAGSDEVLYRRHRSIEQTNPQYKDKSGSMRSSLFTLGGRVSG